MMMDIWISTLTFTKNEWTIMKNYIIFYVIFFEKIIIIVFQFFKKSNCSVTGSRKYKGSIFSFTFQKKGCPTVYKFWRSDRSHSKAFQKKSSGDMSRQISDGSILEICSLTDEVMQKTARLMLEKV